MLLNNKGVILYCRFFHAVCRPFLTKAVVFFLPLLFYIRLYFCVCLLIIMMGFAEEKEGESQKAQKWYLGTELSVWLMILI